MHPAFANIEFGPFTTAYHRQAADDGLKEAFLKFLEGCLLPKPDQSPIFATAVFKPGVTDDKFCGPNSALRDWYYFNCAFKLPPGEQPLPPTETPVFPEIIKVGVFEVQKYSGPHSEVMNFYVNRRRPREYPRSEELRFYPGTRRFMGRPFLFWTVDRMQRHRQAWPAIEALCRSLIRREQAGGICPVCLAGLEVAESSGRFEARCPMNCFDCEYDPQLKRGRFLHGQFLNQEILDLT